MPDRNINATTREPARAAIIDMFGTLVKFQSRGRSWREVLASRGIALDDHIAARYVSQAADGLEHRAASRTSKTYAAWERNRIAAMIRDHKVTGEITDLVDEVHQEWLAWTMTPFPEVPEALSGLRRQGVTIVVCTNWTWDAEKALEQAHLLHLVNAVVVSARIGARKPHPRIFGQALTAAATSPDHTVFIGDGWHTDVLGSLAVGMSAVHVDRQADSREPLGTRVRRIQDLQCLPDLVNTLPW